MDDGERIAEAEAHAARAVARLREVDHRIKNDLQLVASVFVLQSRRAADEAERAMARTALARVSAVAAVHRRLDVQGDPSRLQLAELVRDIVEETVAGARRDDVELALDLSPVTVPARQGAPLGIIVGELVRNALTHGFAGRAGTLSVSLGAEDGEIRLEVRDDGVGAAAAPGFGLTLVALLAQQLRGRFESVAAKPGLSAVVRFPATAGSP